MKRLSVREHFRRIAKATEEDHEERLAGLTVETACRAAARLFSDPRFFQFHVPLPEEDFVPLTALIRRHRSRSGNGPRRRHPRRRRGS